MPDGILLEAKGLVIGQKEILNPENPAVELAIAFYLNDIARIDRVRLEEMIRLSNPISIFFAEREALAAAALSKVLAWIQSRRDFQQASKDAAIAAGKDQLAWLCDDRISQLNSILATIQEWIDGLGDPA